MVTALRRGRTGRCWQEEKRTVALVQALPPSAPLPGDQRPLGPTETCASDAIQAARTLAARRVPAAPRPNLTPAGSQTQEARRSVTGFRARNRLTWILSLHT